MRLYRFPVFLAMLALVPSGCNTPDTIADFCGSSQQALASSVPIFADLGPSCLRVKTLAQEIGSFSVVESDPGCDAIAKQGAASVATVEILAEYFSALHSLAKYDVAKTSSNANDLAAQTAGAVGAGADVQTAVGSIAKFLTTAATSGYQMRSLNKDLVQVNTNVAAVTGALIRILQTNYLDQEMADEDRKLTVHYKEFTQAHPDGQVAVLLDTRWKADRKELEAHRAAAKDAILALQSIQAGVGALAAKAGSLKAKEIPGLLDPYVTQLQDLIPQMQKVL